MRVAIDARELLGHPTGVGRYLAGILEAWQTMPEAAGHEIVLCAPARLDTPLARVGHVTTLTAPGHGTWWEQTVLPRLVRRARADVLFAPGYTCPLLTTVPTVVAIHDVSFAAHPEWFSAKEGARRRLITRLSARCATRVLTISEFSKREIVARLRVGADKIDVVYPGVAPIGGASPAESDRSPTVLYVGSVFARRHVPELVDGFARLARRRPDARLEIVGENRTTPRVDLARLVQDTGLGDRLRLRSFVSDEALTALYRSAGAFVFLSDYEGFGLTPLEALAAGVPIVVLDTAVSREVYGDAALYIARPEPALIAAALDRLFSDVTERARILAGAHAVLARYSWQTCAAQVLDLLHRCATCRDSR